MPIEDIDLLIVGAGPAGLLASIIASKLGLTHQVVERRAGLHTEPSAHVLKTHSMEVYRRLGMAHSIVAQGTPESLQQCVTWCESVTGVIYGKLNLVGQKGRVPRFTEISPAHSVNIPQSVVEPILHARAKALGGDNIVSFETYFRGFSQDGDGVISTLEDGAGTRAVRSRFLIGADGAGSRVRRAAGIDVEGPPALANFLAIHIHSDVRPLLERAPGVLFFIHTPDLEGFFIMHQPNGSQVLMMRYDPDLTPFESFGEAQCRDIIRQAIGADHAFTVAAIDRWAMTAQVARDYRRGRVLLVGDAAHRFPPTGGLGLNTGVEDVENLIWKLGAVLRGHANMTLLDSFAEECRPIAIRNTKQSVTNRIRMAEVAAAIGADGSDADFRAAIEELRSDPGGARAQAAQQAVDDQLPHFSFLELEMAATPLSGAFLPAERSVAQPLAPVEGYLPSFAPGSHIPHLWIAPDVSTIDMLRFDSFTLFVPKEDEAAWRSAVAELPGQGMPVGVVALSGDMRSDRASAADYWGDTPYAVLVRPDGRIAWVEPAALRDRAGALRDALHKVTRAAEHPDEAAAA
ncbi:FAD-dependent monooxygenase [Sphingobium sp. SCG-1]|uniref:FAD-dependent monooxygenase n=1 Tax=Sphingobium sp. SCG-1 TaxID=2072936 RepID=UPI00166FC653|nr:FAD-dependent monooxygenase [Sphingobium sp. SCG-1]